MPPNESPVGADPGASWRLPEPPLGRGREVAWLGAILAAALVLWVLGVDRLDFHRSMESSRALVAQQMIRTGDYVVPKRGDEIYLAKPPLFYWATVGLSQVAGGRVTETTVRLASSLSVLGMLLVTVLAARRSLGARTALLAAAIAATAPFALEMARDGTVDTMLALGATIALFGAWLLLEPGRTSLLPAVACGVGIAIGLLTKGPIVLLFLVPTVVLYVGFRGEGTLARSWRAWGPWLGGAALAIWIVGAVAPSVGKVAAIGYVVPVALLAGFAARGSWGVGGVRAWLAVAGTVVVLSVPWLVFAAERLGFDTLVQKLGREIWVDRIAEVGSSNKGDFWTYALEVPVGCLPFFLFLPLAMLPGYAADASPARRRLLLFLRCWLVGSAVVFTVVGEARRVRYLFPALPAVALLSADALVSFIRGLLAGKAATYADRVTRAVVILLCLAPLALTLLWSSTGLGVTTAGVACVAAATVGAIAGVVLLRKGRRCAALLASASLCLLGLAIHEGYGRSAGLNHRSSPRPGSLRFRSHVPAGETLWLADLPSYGASFYLDATPLGLLHADPARLDRAQQLYVGLDAATRDRVSLPSGFTVEEVHREPIPGAELVLLRLRRTKATGD